MDGYVCWESKKEGACHQTATLGNMTESGYYTVQKNTIEKKHSGENPQPRKTTAEKSTLEKNTAEKSTVEKKHTREKHSNMTESGYYRTNIARIANANPSCVLGACVLAKDIDQPT